MAKDNIRSYSSTAASNTDVGGINLSEGVMVPSDLNNSLREIMSHLADFSAGTEGIDVLSLEDDDASAAIKFQAPATVTTTTTFTLPDGDGSSNQVLSTDGSGTLSWYTIPAAAAEMVSGMLMPFAGSSAPSGWLLCYGQAISRTTYADLFTAIGTTYGTGDGSTTFNLPDLRGRVIAGQDDMGGSSANRLTGQTGGVDGDTLGGTGGAETHTLTTAQMPAHTHGAGSLRGTDTSGGGDPASAGYDGSSGTGSTANPVLTGTTGSTGGGGAHNNVQPTLILNYIIKT